MSGNVPSPAERLQAAADRIREVAGKATPGPWVGDPTGTVCAESDLRIDENGSEILPFEGPSEVAECYRSERYEERGCNAAFIALFDPVTAELVAVLLEGMAAHWATRPIADWNDYAITPLAALERHINGEEKP